MTLIFDFFYFVGLLLALPFLLLKSMRTGKYRRDLDARFGYIKEAQSRFESGGQGKTILIHCVSVGELLSARMLVDRLMLADPTIKIAITTTTDTGTDRAKKLFSEDAKYKERVRTYRYPLDFSGAVKRLLNHVKPDLIVLIELEIWPNFVRIASKRKIPVVIVNGRMTEKSYGQYKKFRIIFGPLLRKLAWIGAQTPVYYERFVTAGASVQKVVVVPTLKYDSAEVNMAMPAGAHVLASSCGLPMPGTSDLLIFTAGSTGAGEEVPVIQSFLNLKKDNPLLRLAIAPRHPESVTGVVNALQEAGLTPVLRSQKSDSTAAKHLLTQDEVFVLDTLGELRKLYYLSQFVFVGRSLVPLGGSDMIEVAAMAKPVCFGPHTFNFAEPVDLLINHDAATLVADANMLTEVLSQWVTHPESAAAMGQRARDTVVAQQGSTTRYVESLLATLNGKDAPILKKEPAISDIKIPEKTKKHTPAEKRFK